MNSFYKVAVAVGIVAVAAFIASPASSQVEAARAAGHNVVSCSDASDTAITVPLADVFGGSVSQGAQTLSVIATSATPVYVYSKNGEAATEGLQVCTASPCASSVDLPGPASLWQCKSSSGAVDISVIGTTR